MTFGGGSAVIPLTAGCRKDIQRLLNAFREVGTLSFEAFAKCFREIDFVTIFMGRMKTAELVEFSEKLLQLSVSYAMSFREVRPDDYTEPSTSAKGSFNDSGEYSLLERIFGLYLTYSLYYVQPSANVSSIRITPEQAHDLSAFVHDILIPDKHYDAVVAYFRLVAHGAFRIVAFENEYSPLLHRRFDKSELNDETLPQFEELSLLKSIANDALLTQADLVHERYQAAKQACNLPNVSAVDVIKKSVSDLYQDVFENAQQREHRASVMGGKTLGYQPKMSRSSIKEKAYKTKTVNPRHRRHRALSGYSSSGFQSPTKEITTLEDLLLSAASTSAAEAVHQPGKSEKGRRKPTVEDNFAVDAAASTPRKKKKTRRPSGKARKNKPTEDEPIDLAKGLSDAKLEDEKERKLDMIFKKLHDEAMET